jgi:hypothetical protein
MARAMDRLVKKEMAIRNCRLRVFSSIDQVAPVAGRKSFSIRPAQIEARINAETAAPRGPSRTATRVSIGNTSSGVGKRMGRKHRTLAAATRP